MLILVSPHCHRHDRQQYFTFVINYHQRLRVVIITPLPLYDNPRPVAFLGGDLLLLGKEEVNLKAVLGSTSGSQDWQTHREKIDRQQHVLQIYSGSKATPRLHILCLHVQQH